MPPILPTKPGWYPNPTERSSLRYWDGANWTARYRPRPPWVAQQADLEQWRDGHDRSIEGPVHPRHLREPVASGVASYHEALRWRALQAYRGWHRPSAPAPDAQGPVRLAPMAKFGSGRRPLTLFVLMVVIAVGVVVSSFAVIGPYERAGEDARFATQPSQSRFVTLAARDCAATLPKDRLTLLTGFDGPSVREAADQMDHLRARLAALGPGAAIEAEVEAWLADWQQFVALQRSYAGIIGPAQRRDGRLAPRPLAPQTRSEALATHRDALAVAEQADHYTADLHLPACTLEQTGTG